MRRRRGLTMAEIVVAVLVFSMIFAMVFSLFDMGSRVFQFSGIGAEVRNEAAVLMERLGRVINQSNFDGSSAADETLSVLSALDDDGKLTYDSQGHPTWQKYLVFYVDSNHVLRQTSYALSYPTATAQVIEQYDFGTGVQPLSSYAEDGRRLVSGVTVFQAQVNPDRTVAIRLVIEREQRREKPPVRVEMESLLAFRNGI
jgi:type II secretory pathway component PulJ